MSLKTNIRKQGDTVIVSIEGRLDFETSDLFRESLLQMEQNLAQSRVIFDMGGLDFVGSSGISAFIRALRDFNERLPTKPRYTNVRSEFKKIISAFDQSKSFEFWDSTERALRALDN